MNEHIEAVQKMQDYIATHLDTNITMADLAKVSKFSPWYSYRLFVDLLHMTPAVYIQNAPAYPPAAGSVPDGCGYRCRCTGSAEAGRRPERDTEVPGGRSSPHGDRCRPP